MKNSTVVLYWVPAILIPWTAPSIIGREYSLSRSEIALLPVELFWLRDKEDGVTFLMSVDSVDEAERRFLVALSLATVAACRAIYLWGCFD